MKVKSIAVMTGYWSTNIGNSFFQIGAKYVLREAFPQAQVVLAADQPGYYRVSRGNPENAFIPLEHIPMDYLVILGPFLRPEYKRIWGETIKKLSARGVRIMILSAGMMDYSKELIEKSRRWLGEVQPYVFTTRDEETYHNFADLAEHSFNGIDAAFFISDLYDPVPLDIDEFVVFNFDKIPEPYIKVRDGSDCINEANYAFHYDDSTWCFNQPTLRTGLARRYRIFSFLAPFLRPKSSYPGKIDGKRIIRTDHRFNPLLLGKAYKGPNSFVSDIPWPYLDIYSQASCVFSNRVHACVAALTYGKPAMLFYKTPRARLLQRVGANNITQKPCTIPIERLEREKRAMLDFLQQVPL
jgi:hypothetical protein